MPKITSNLFKMIIINASQFFCQTQNQFPNSKCSKQYNKKVCNNIMFSQLMKKYQSTMQSTKQATKQVEQDLTQIRNQIGIPQIDNYFDPTESYGKAVSFGKASRFKQLQKQQLRTTDVSFSSAASSVQIKNKAYTFKRGQRWEKDKPQVQTVINPQYDVVKKNNKNAPIIKKTVLSDMEKSRISQATMASNSEEVGPGSYSVNVDKGAKNTSFSKGKRFAKQNIINNDIPLYPKDTLTKKRPTSNAILKKALPRTKNLINRDQQQQLRQRLKMVYWNSIPLQLDRLLKNNIGPVLKQKYFDIKKLKGIQKRCAMLLFLKQMNDIRGGFQYQIRTKIQQQPCAVAYRKSTPKPFKFSEMEPGPDFYYPVDDLTKPNVIGFSFGKANVEKKQPQTDFRNYQINEDIFKKGGNIIINPQHTPHRLTQQQIRSLNRGPGFYDCLFSQIQKRDDIGVLKFQPITETNARENNMMEKKEVNDGIYYPSYDAIDPNIAAPLYKDPANVKPKNIPDKQLFPEHWLFYDGDLNKVRAQIAKNVILAKNMPFKKYKQYAQHFKAFKKYLKDRDFQPQLGQYKPEYTQLDKHLPQIDFKKMAQKQINCQGIKKQQGDVDGDNLLIQPQKPQKHIGKIDFQKMIGRETQQLANDEAYDGDRLLIEPKLPEKKIANIIFDKMIGRPQNNNDPDDIPEGDRVIINPKQPQKHIPTIDLQKKPERQTFFKKKKDEDDQQPQIILNPKQIPKKIKGFVQLGRLSSVRLVPLLRQNEKKENNQS